MTSDKIFPRSHGLSWADIAIPSICAFGVIGNLLNLLVLTRRRLLHSMDRLEKSATYGLVALAFSDMMFCVAVFPHGFLSQHGYALQWEYIYELYYKIYGIASINLFIMVSTWLVVSMAVNRYIVVVYPFHARRVLGTARTIITIIALYAMSFTFTLPFYLHKTIKPCQWLQGDTMYELANFFNLEVSASIRTYIRWAWPIFAVFIPVIILAFCNIRLIQALRLATVARKRTCQGQVLRDSSQKVTLTLVIIVLMILLLVSPSEILRYINPFKAWGKAGAVVALVSNVMQTFNFAFNFVLYCAVNATFRQTLKLFFTCCLPDKGDSTETQTMLSPMSTTRSGNILSETDDSRYQNHVCV